MSGVGEAATIIGLITGTIEIVKSTTSLYQTFKDSKGQPKQFSKIAARFPLLLEILGNAEKNAQPTKLNDGQRKEVENIIKDCRDKVEMLQKIFVAVLRVDDDKWLDRLKKAVAASGRGKRVEELMMEIMKDIELVTCDRLLGTATGDEIERLRKAIQEMIDMPPSIPDDGGSITQHNSGGGNNIASRVTNNNIGEGTYTNSNTGGGPQLNHNGPGIFNYNNHGPETLLQSLYFPEMDSHRKRISKTDVNTCKWIYDETAYKDWLARRQRLLWIVGIPGSGKSTLMKYIYRQDKSRTKPNSGIEKPSQRAPKTLIVASFFCYGTGDLIQKSRAGLFRSLLHQILQKIPTPPPEVTSEFNKKCELQGKHRKKWDWHERDLEKILQTSISHIAKEYPDKYALRIYVDALDEFSSNEPNGGKERSYMAEFFQGLVSQSKAGIDLNVCISCRDYPFIAKGGLKISIGNKNHQDILAYVQTKLSSIYGESDGARELIDWIAAKASGIFQWAVIVVENVQEFDEDMGTDSPKHILKRLEHLPQGLDELYEKSFQTMERSRRLQSLKLLRLICFSWRPLSVKEVYDAMESDPYSSLTDRALWPKAVDCKINEMENIIKSFSCNLAAIIEYEGNERHSTVEPRHQSVYDYLVSSGLQYLDDNALGANSLSSRAIGHAHLELSRYCVKYLSSKKVLTKCHNLKLPEVADRIIGTGPLPLPPLRYGIFMEIAQEVAFEQEVTDLKDEFPFFGYAVSSWAHHANIAENKNSGHEEDLLKFYQELINIPFKKLGQVRIWIDHERGLRPTALLHIASGHHLTRLVELILKNQNTLKNASIANGIRPYEMPDTVGINMAIHGIMHQTPLQLAVDKDNRDVVELLLQHSNIDLNVQNLFGQTGLMRAVLFKREELVGILLQHSEIDVNVRGDFEETALFEAVRCKHEGILTMLLEHRNIDVNAKSVLSKTVLSVAVEEGLEKIVRVLLETRKADIQISPSSKSYRSPLIVAVEKGHWTIVELLLGFRGRMSEADKQVAGALEKLPTDERSKMSSYTRRNYAHKAIAQEQVQTKPSKFAAWRKRFRKK